MTKQTKTNIGVGSVVKAKVGELEKITRKGGSRRIRKEVVDVSNVWLGRISSLSY